MPEYIKILKSTMDTAWYANKIGFIFKVDPKVKFPNFYTIRISKSKHKANWGNVDFDNAEVIVPGLIQKLIIWATGSFKTKQNGS